MFLCCSINPRNDISNFFYVKIYTYKFNGMNLKSKFTKFSSISTLYTKKL